MKKHLLALTFGLVAFTGFYANAQFSFGGSLAYGSESEDLGFQLRAMYGINEHWRPAVDYIYYFDGVENFSLNEFNLNTHFNFVGQEKFSAHLLAGLNLMIFRISGFGGNISNTEVGFNLGAGGQISITDNISALAELKYNLASDFDQLVIGVGAVYTLGK